MHPPLESLSPDDPCGEVHALSASSAKRATCIAVFVVQEGAARPSDAVATALRALALPLAHSAEVLAHFDGMRIAHGETVRSLVVEGILDWLTGEAQDASHWLSQIGHQLGRTEIRREGTGLSWTRERAVELYETWLRAETVAVAA